MMGRLRVVSRPTSSSKKSARWLIWKSTSGRPFSAPTFPEPVKIYHNEGVHTPAHVALMLKTGAEVWHFGSDVHDTLQITGLERVFRIYGSLSEATAAAPPS